MMGGTSLKGDSLKVLLDALLEKQEDGEQGEVKSKAFSFQFQHTVFSCSPH